MVAKNNALARGLLNETLLVENTTRCEDNRGDKWFLHKNCLVRNHTHPEFIGKKNEDHETHGHRSAWINSRTGETHEGSMSLDSNGKASPHPYEARLFHSSHYFHHE
jgi:hypothetical protein